MATMTIRSTYSLDVDTVRALERLAAAWKVSKSEALRRAIRAAQTDDAADPLVLLTKLQASVALSPKAAEKWIRDVEAERRSTGRRASR